MSTEGIYSSKWDQNGIKNGLEKVPMATKVLMATKIPMVTKFQWQQKF